MIFNVNPLAVLFGDPDSLPCEPPGKGQPARDGVITLNQSFRLMIAVSPFFIFQICRIREGQPVLDFCKSLRSRSGDSCFVIYSDFHTQYPFFLRMRYVSTDLTDFNRQILLKSVKSVYR